MTDYFVIEEGIPPPPRPAGQGGSSRVRRWDALEVNQSMLVPSIHAGRAARAWATRNGRAFLTEKQQGGDRGWRVWRIA